MDVADSGHRSAVSRFENAAERLKNRYAGDETLARQVQDFIEGCQYTVTGNVIFT